jgi:hypothetical protein
MNLGALLSRVYHIAGDSKASPRFFPRARCVKLANDACLMFRQQIEDRYYRTDQAVTAAVGVYTFPAGHLRAIRVAFEDETVEPSTVQELQSLDDLWQTRTSPKPYRWTSQGQAHDEWRFYPRPSSSTEFPVAFNQDTGVVTRYVDSAGAATFTQETGIVVQITDINVSPDVGEVAAFNLTSTSQATIWGVQAPGALSGDGEEIPVKNGYQMAVCYYILWQLYEDEGDHHNAVLAGFYRMKMRERLERARALKDNPLPTEKHVLRGGSAEAWENETGRPASPWPTSVDLSAHGGSANQSIGWPRRGYF